MAHTADQALQRGHAGQQHLVRQQPGGRPVEQQPGPVITRPAQDIEPPGQPEPGRRIFLEVAEPILLADGRGVPPSLPAVAVAFQARRLRLPELARHGRHHGRRRLGGIVQEGAKEAGRPKLDREAKPVMGTPASGRPARGRLHRGGSGGRAAPRWGRRRSGRIGPAVRRTGNGSAWRAELRTCTSVRAWTKDQALTCCKYPMRNSWFMR